MSRDSKKSRTEVEGSGAPAERETNSFSLYEQAWDGYARVWDRLHPGLGHIGDEWIGVEAGAASSLDQYTRLIEERFVAPFIGPQQDVLEIGVGGGRTAAVLLDHCRRLICVDASGEMLDATRDRLGEERVRYVKNDGIRLDAIEDEAADVCFCFDTMVHIEPRDIFNYLEQIPRLLRGERLCVFHHSDVLTELGWSKFLGEWHTSLGGHRHGTVFSVMTAAIMERFLEQWGYEVLVRDSESVPRDCVWVCRAPRRHDP